MNRLGNYLRAKSLARTLLRQAEEKLSQGRMETALKYLIMAATDILTAQNCLVSLAFEKRRKFGKR